jgi:serine protease inhibitor
VTEGKIANLVNEEAVSNAVLLLVNALYFEGKWLNAFNKTVQRQFNRSNGRKQTTFMEHTRNYYFISSDKLNSRILRIPYAGEKYSMFIILPKDGTTVDQVISKLDHRALSNEIKDLEEIEVHAVIPRFKFDTSVKLNDAIKAVSYS